MDETHEARLCQIVYDWHKWYVHSKDWTPPPTPTEHLIDMCHELGYGLAFSDVRAIHSFIASSYYGVWQRRGTVNPLQRQYEERCKQVDHLAEVNKRVRAANRYLQAENKILEKENAELHAERELTKQFWEIRREQEREQMLVMRRMKPHLEKFWADTWDRVWNGDPDAKDSFP